MDDMGPEHFALMQKLCDLESSILKDIPLGSLDMLSHAWSEILLFDGRECFSRGFRLGVQLTLAALS